MQSFTSVKKAAMGMPTWSGPNRVVWEKKRSARMFLLYFLPQATQHRQPTSTKKSAMSSLLTPWTASLSLQANVYYLKASPFKHYSRLEKAVSKEVHEKETLLLDWRNSGEDCQTEAVRWWVFPWRFLSQTVDLSHSNAAYHIMWHPMQGGIHIFWSKTHFFDPTFIF